MKKISLLAGLALSLFSGSCKKDNSDGVTPASAQKKITTTTFDEHWTFTYNADGTLKTMDIPSANYSQEISYAPGKIKIKNVAEGKITSDGEYSFTNGKPVKLQYTNFNSLGQPTGTYNEMYEFNAKGLLSKRIYNDNSYETYEYDGNDNLVLSTYFNAQGTPKSKSEYTYGNQKDLCPQYGYLASDVSGFFFPRLSNYLPVSKKTTNLPGNIISYHSTLTYEFDEQGYVIKGKSHSLHPNYSDYEWTNTYQ